MYKVYIINYSLLLIEGYDCSDERFKEIAETVLTLKEFQQQINSGEYDRDTNYLRILK